MNRNRIYFHTPAYLQMLCLCSVFLFSCKVSQQTQKQDIQLPDEISVHEISSGTNPHVDSLVIERDFIDACKARALGDNEGAIVLFKEVLKMDPQNAPSLYELSRIYFEYGRIEDSRQLALAAVQSDSENPYYQYLLADIYTYNQNFTEAADILEQLRKKYPEQMDNYFQLAYVYQRTGDLNKSIDVLKAANELFGDQESILTELEKLYIQSGDAASAIDNLQKLIETNPGNPAYYSMLGDIYDLTKNSAIADETFQKLLAIDPDNPDLMIRKAEMEKARGNISGYYQSIRSVFNNPAVSIDKKVFFLVPYVDSIGKKDFVQHDTILSLAALLPKVHPEDAKSFAMLGDFLYYDGQLAEARKNYRQSIAIRSDVYDVWMKVFYIDADQMQYDSLENISALSLELFPNQPMGYYFNGIALISEKQYSQAIAVLKRALPVAVSNPKLKADIYLRLGDAYNELKDYSSSDDAYTASLAINPKNPYTLNNYAYHLSVRGENLEKASEMAMLANELVPDNESLLDTYAWILYRQGNFKEARSWQEKALQAGGDKSEVVVEHYGDILFQLGNTDEAVEQWKKAKQLGKGSSTLDKKISERKLYE